MRAFSHSYRQSALNEPLIVAVCHRSIRLPLTRCRASRPGADIHQPKWHKVGYTVILFLSILVEVFQRCMQQNVDYF